MANTKVKWVSDVRSKPVETVPGDNLRVLTAAAKDDQDQWWPAGTEFRALTGGAEPRDNRSGFGHAVNVTVMPTQKPSSIAKKTERSLALAAVKERRPYAGTESREQRMLRRDVLVALLRDKLIEHVPPALGPDDLRITALGRVELR